MKTAKELAEELSKALDANKDLLARVERAEKVAEFTETEKRHYVTLSDEDKATFLSKSASDRIEITKSLEVDDAVVYTSAAGEVFTKSDDSRLVEMAKRGDRLQAQIEDEQLEKRAEANLANLPGPVAVRAALLKAVDGIADDETRKAAHEAVQAGDKALKAAFNTVGSRGESLAKTARDFEKFVGDVMKRDNCSRTRALEVAARENPEAFNAYQEA